MQVCKKPNLDQACRSRWRLQFRVLNQGQF